MADPLALRSSMLRLRALAVAVGACCLGILWLCVQGLLLCPQFVVCCVPACLRYLQPRCGVSLYPNVVLVYRWGQLKYVGDDCTGQAVSSVCAHMPLSVPCVLASGGHFGQQDEL